MVSEVAYRTETGVVDARDRVTANTRALAGAPVPPLPSFTVASAIEIAGRVWAGVPAGTPLMVRPVGAEATAPGVA